MKYLFRFLILSLFFCSCKKDQPKSEPYANSPIIGKWYLTKDSVFNYHNNELTRVVSVLSFTAPNEGFYDQFNTDGSAVFSRAYDALNGVFIISGKTVSIITPSYTVSGSGGSYTVAGISQTGDFALVTANQLVIRSSTYEFVAGDTIKVTEAAYFSK